jgi:hypothetical protein
MVINRSVTVELHLKDPLRRIKRLSGNLRRHRRYKFRDAFYLHGSRLPIHKLTPISRIAPEGRGRVREVVYIWLYGVVRPNPRKFRQAVCHNISAYNPKCCIWLVTSTQEPRRCGQSPSRNFRKLQPLRPGPQCHSAPGAQYRARDTNLVRKPLATQNLTVPSTYSS